MKTQAAKILASLLLVAGFSSVALNAQPTVKSVGSVRHDAVTQVTVVFSDPVDPVSGATPGNYTFAGGTITVTGASMMTGLPAANAVGVAENPAPGGRVVDNQCVVLTVTGLAVDATATITIQNVQDTSTPPKTIPSTAITFKDSGYAWAESGTPALAGKVIAVGTNGFDIFSAGSGQWADYDEVTMVYKQVAGDFDLKARIEFLDFSSHWARAGVMARESLNEGENSATQTGDPNATPPVRGTASRYADVHANPVMDFNENGPPPEIHPANNGWESHIRRATGRQGDNGGTDSQNNTGGNPPFPNAWVRIQRTGTDIHTFHGSDGVNWDIARDRLADEWLDTDDVTPLPLKPTMFVGPAFGPETINIPTSDTDGKNRLFLYQVRFTAILVPYLRLVDPTPTGVFMLIEDAIPPGTQVDTSTVQLTFDGNPVTASATKSGTTTTVAYKAASPYAPNSSHSFTLTFKDNATPASSQTVSRNFTIPNYPTIPASYAVTVDTTKPGFKFKVHQVDLGQTLPATVARAERQLHGDIGANVANVASLTPASGGYYSESAVINYEQGDATATPLPAGDFTNEVLIPGIPGNGVIADRNLDNIAMEILAYIQFPAAGAYRITFNSDEGFRTYVGDRAVDVLNSPIISEADVARGASDTAQWVYVAQAGAYPFRTVWFEGGGGASLEWSAESDAGVRALINDSSVTGALKAYQEATGPKPVTVTYAYPDRSSGNPYFANDPITIEWTDGTTLLNKGSIQLSVNGTPVTATQTTAGLVTKLQYSPPAPGWPSGSNNKVTLVWSDNGAPAVVRTNTWNFSVMPWVTVPPSAAIAASAVDTSKTGFKIKTYKIDAQNDIANTIASALAMLSGASGANKLDTSAVGADGYFVDTGVINYEHGALPANAAYDAASVAPARSGDFTDQIPVDVPVADVLFPGEPITDATYGTLVYSNKWGDNMAMEVLTVLDLQPGWYWTGVNSDDGFRVSFAANPLDATAVVADIADFGKGASDVNGLFYVQQAGLYPCRLIWEQGGGGGSCEWYMQNTLNYQRTLVNENAVAGYIKAYQYPAGASPASYVKSVSPNDPAGGIRAGVGVGKQVQVVIVDGSTAVDQNSITLKLNGTAVSPITKNKVGNETTVTYSQPLPANTLVTVQVSWTDAAPRSSSWSFTTGVLPGNTFLIEAEDFNTGGGQTVAAASTMPYLGNSYSNLNAVLGIDFLRPHQADSPLYRARGTNSLQIPGYPTNNLVNVPMDLGPGDFDRGGWDMTVNYKIGWTGANQWYDYTRTFPAANYNVYAALSHGDPPTSTSRVRASLQQITAGQTTTNQTVVQLGTFDGPATGGWGLNRLVPLMNGTQLASVPLSGTQTIRLTTDSGDYDFLAFVPGGAAQIRINSIAIASGQVTITWSGGGSLEWTTSLTPTISWTPTGNSSGSFSEPVATTGNKFYHVKQ